MENEWKAENICWSINSDTSGEVEDWVEENKVNFSDSNGRIWIDPIPDGIYEVNQRNFGTNRRISLKTKVLVWNGKVDIQSSKEAVAEFLNKTGDCHTFIEAVTFGKKNTKVIHQNGDVETVRTIQFHLGS
tara:strand:+ start:110 stop:502 length:393 start_codon:yes stop_codon:yes gene_type:complete